MGQVLFFYDFDWAGAEREFRWAIELNPNLAEAHDAYGTYLASMNHPEAAITEMEVARRLDPLSPIILADAAWVNYCARRYEKTVEECRKALDLDPEFPPALGILGLGLEKTRRFEEAVAVLEKAVRLDPSPSSLEMLGGAYAAWGKKDEARKVLAKLEERSKKRYVCPYEIATVYAGLGDKDGAFRKLEEAAEDRADCVPWIQPDSKIDPLRSDPRYVSLMRRIGLSS
jgi:tetratricopeptide (TPR) repeat protein